MNLNNLGQARQLARQLDAVRASISRVKNLRLKLLAGADYVGVEDDTHKAIETLVRADLDRREAAILNELSALGVTVTEPDKASDTKCEEACCATAPEISIEIVNGGKISPDVIARMFGGLAFGQGGIVGGRGL